MIKWTDYYRIVEIDGMTKSNDFWAESEYHLEDADGKIVGVYKDYKYAKKQAKYKFKKLQAKLEKILLA